MFWVNPSPILHTPPPLCPLSLASLTFLGGRLDAGGGSAAGWPLEGSGHKKLLALASGPSAFRLPAHLVPCLCPGQDRAPPPWLPFPLWKLESLVQLGNGEVLVQAPARWECQKGNPAAGCGELAACMCCASVIRKGAAATSVSSLVQCARTPFLSPLRLSQ